MKAKHGSFAVVQTQVKKKSFIGTLKFMILRLLHNYSNIDGQQIAKYGKIFLLFYYNVTVQLQRETNLWAKR